MKNLVNKLKRISCAKVLMAIFSFVVIFIFIVSGITFTRQFFSNNSYSYMVDKSKTNTKFFSNQSDKVFITLESTALMISLNDNITSDAVLIKLKDISASMGFKRMAVVLPDGKSYSDDNLVFDSSNQRYFLDAIKEKKVMTEVEESPIDKNAYICISCPINSNNAFLGVLVAWVEDVSARDLFGLNSSMYSDGCLLINSQGKILFGKNRNYYVDLLNNSICDEQAINELGINVSSNRPYFFNYEQDNEKYYAYSNPMGKNGWSLISTQSDNNINGRFSDVLIKYHLFSALAFILIIVLIIHIFYILIIYNDKKRIIKEENSLLKELSDSNIFVYNIKTKEISITEPIRQYLGCESKSGFGLQFILDSGIILENHKIMITDFFERIDSGIASNEAYIRIRNEDNKFRLFEINAKTVFSRKGLPLKAIGCITENIKSNSNDEEMILYDNLTGLLNRSATKNYVSEYITTNVSETCALLILDLNNFKGVNDEFGYSFGDEVICSISVELRKLFRSSDIIGRTGDDEFSVFLKNAKSLDLIIEKIDLIFKIVTNTVVNGIHVPLSSNIGISMYPDDADNFNDIYANAEAALFISKRNGLNTYQFYKNI